MSNSIDQIKYIFGIQFGLRMPDCLVYIKPNRCSRWHLYFSWNRYCNGQQRYSVGRSDARSWTSWGVLTPWFHIAIIRSRWSDEEIPAWILERDAKYRADLNITVAST